MAHPNKFKYLKPPTLEQIDAVIEKAGVVEAQWERYNQIPSGTMRQVRLGNRSLPAQFWHLIFESQTNGATRRATKPTPKAAIRPVRVKSTGSLSRIVS